MRTLPAYTSHHEEERTSLTLWIDHIYILMDYYDMICSSWLMVPAVAWTLRSSYHRQGLLLVAQRRLHYLAVRHLYICCIIVNVANPARWQQTGPITVVARQGRYFFVGDHVTTLYVISHTASYIYSKCRLTCSTTMYIHQVQVSYYCSCMYLN